MSKSPPPHPLRPPGPAAPRAQRGAPQRSYRRQGGVLEVLMGERNRKHRFLPERYVFPGGRVDGIDSRVRVATALRNDVTAQLERRLKPSRARAVALAAVRETFEETGLIIGAPDPDQARGVPEQWRPFFASGMGPALHHLDYVARAVTPPFRPLRFDARFFMIDQRHVTGDLRGSGELLDLRWFTIGEACGLELARVTLKVLEHVDELAADQPPRSPDRPIPYFKYMPDRHIRIDE